MGSLFPRLTSAGMGKTHHAYFRLPLPPNVAPAHPRNRHTRAPVRYGRARRRFVLSSLIPGDVSKSTMMGLFIFAGVGVVRVVLERWRSFWRSFVRLGVHPPLPVRKTGDDDC
jgi:hypothetical protein